MGADIHCYLEVATSVTTTTATVDDDSVSASQQVASLMISSTTSLSTADMVVKWVEKPDATLWCYQKLDKYAADWQPDMIDIGRHYLFFDMIGYVTDVAGYKLRTFRAGRSKDDVKVLPRAGYLNPCRLSPRVQFHYYSPDRIHYSSSIMTAAEFHNDNFWSSQLVECIPEDADSFLVDKDFIDDYDQQFANCHHKLVGDYKSHCTGAYNVIDGCIDHTMAHYKLSDCDKDKIRFVYWFDQ